MPTLNKGSLELIKKKQNESNLNNYYIIDLKTGNLTHPKIRYQFVFDGVVFGTIKI